MQNEMEFQRDILTFHKIVRQKRITVSLAPAVSHAGELYRYIVSTARTCPDKLLTMLQ